MCGGIHSACTSRRPLGPGAGKGGIWGWALQAAQEPVSPGCCDPLRLSQPLLLARRGSLGGRMFGFVCYLGPSLLGTQ